MNGAFGSSVAMTWPIPSPRWPVAMPKWMTELGIDWEKTGALLGGLVTGALVIRALFRPLWDKLVYTAMRDRCDIYDKTATLAKTNADRLEALEAAVIAQGTALRDMPRLITTTERLCETLGELNVTMKNMDEDVRGLREFRAHVEGMYQGEERRKRQLPTPHRRREDDPR